MCATFTTAAAAGAAAAPSIFWTSDPTRPGDAVSVSGAGFGEGCVANVSSAGGGAAFSLAPEPGTLFDAALVFSLPAAAPLDAWQLVVACPGGRTSAPWWLNRARPWWLQGDAGAAASPGGWVRAYGQTLALEPSARVGARMALRAAARALTDADAPLGSGEALLAAAAAATAAAAAYAAAPAVGATTLRLTPSGGGAPVDVEAANATAFGAVFLLPLSLPLGAYEAAVSNGLGGFVALDTFVSADAPNVSGIAIVAPPAYPPGVFVVNVTSEPSGPRTAPANYSDDSLAAALAAASAAGGGTVFFPAGSYFLSRPIVVPPNTRLLGAGIGATKITFAEFNASSAPPTLIAMNDTAAAALGGGAAWGLGDLEVHVTAFHNTVVYASNHSRGFSMARVRARANADFAGDEQFTAHNGRWQNWSWASAGPLVDVHAVGWQITDCDLLATNTVLTSYTTNWHGAASPARHGSSYGYVARNRIWNGGEGAFFNQWGQVAFEDNAISGVGLMSMGNSLGTGPGGGNVQNVYLGESTWRHVYGNDREVLTGDCQGGAYFGALAAVDGAVITTANDTWPCGSLEWGCWDSVAVTIGNGTGIAQTRRVRIPGAGVGPSPTNRTWELAQPFDVAPVPGESFVEIHPYRGRVIVFGNSYTDVGSVQLWQHYIETTLAENVMARGTGFVSWGQFDGPYSAPPRNASSFTWTPGWQPNLRVQWLSNAVSEAQTLANFNSESYYDAFYQGYRYVAFPQGYVSEYGINAPPVNLFVVWRDNTGIGTGLWLCGGQDTQSHMKGGTNFSVVQRNVFSRASAIPDGRPCIRVDESCERVFVAPDNECVP